MPYYGELVWRRIGKESVQTGRQSMTHWALVCDARAGLKLTALLIRSCVRIGRSISAMASVASRLRRFLMEGCLRIRAWHARFASLHRVKAPLYLTRIPM